MAFSLRDALRWFQGGDKKAKPAFKSEQEAYKFLRNLYKKTGGVTPELRRTYEFYQQQIDDGCEPASGPRESAGASARR